jgi:hypothetical protein
VFIIDKKQVFFFLNMYLFKKMPRRHPKPEEKRSTPFEEIEARREQRAERRRKKSPSYDRRRLLIPAEVELLNSQLETAPKSLRGNIQRELELNRRSADPNPELANF